MEARGTPAYVAELLGTLLLVLFIGSIVAVLGAGPTGGGIGQVVLALTFLHAFVLMMLVYTLGGTSGAHFNPAVTVALATLKKISVRDGGIYIVMQLIGGTLGALLVRLIYSDAAKKVNEGAAGIKGGLLSGKPATGLLVEALGTFVLMFAIMGTAVNPRGQKEFAGLVIGSTLGFAVLCFGPLTGGSFNPARAFGPALVSGTFDDFWLYVVGPIVGAVLAAALYHVLVLAPKGREEVRPIDKLD